MCFRIELLSDYMFIVYAMHVLLQFPPHYITSKNFNSLDNITIKIVIIVYTKLTYISNTFMRLVHFSSWPFNYIICYMHDFVFTTYSYGEMELQIVSDGIKANLQP